VGTARRGAAGDPCAIVSILFVGKLLRTCNPTYEESSPFGDVRNELHESSFFLKADNHFPSVWLSFWLLLTATTVKS
jgi:hypothetical protein